MSGSIYMERNESFKYTHFYFLNKKAVDFSKTIFYCLKHLPSIVSYYSQKKILSFTKFSGKRKYYKELIFYEQCRLARIINKSGWAVVS